MLLRLLMSKYLMECKCSSKRISDSMLAFTALYLPVVKGS